MGSFVFQDQNGRYYPSLSRRLAPDFGFHPQVYRQDGEKVTLPAGEFSMEISRGPEYIVSTRKITVGNEPQTASFTEAPGQAP